MVDAELSAEIAARRWSAGVFVTNPADSSGNTFAYGNPFTFGQVRQVTPQRPRTIGLPPRRRILKICRNPVPRRGGQALPAASYY